MCLLGFHLGAPNAPGESEADVAALGGRFADRGVVGVEAAAAGADGAEQIGHVEEQRQSTVEEVGTHAAVEGEIGVDLGQRRLGAATIDVLFLGVCFSHTAVQSRAWNCPQKIAAD